MYMYTYHTPEDGHNRLKRVIMIGDHHQVQSVIVQYMDTIWTQFYE